MPPDELFSIGEFSNVTDLTVKTLRFYHEENLLTPTAVDGETGCRYYDAKYLTEIQMLVKA
jgi:DNA-binding transcriptional MerR regulator